MVFTDPGADKPLLEVKTFHCCHCGGQWVPKPGSGITRGWCTQCCAPICGPGCVECVPLEQYLDNLEKGRDPTFRPIVVPVGPIDVPLGFKSRSGNMRLGGDES